MRRRILFVFLILFAVIFATSKVIAVSYVYPTSYNYLLMTKGFNQPLTQGDWYTSFESGSTARYHKYLVVIRPDMLKNQTGGAAVWFEDSDSNGENDIIDNNAQNTTKCGGSNICDDAKYQIKNFDGSVLWGSKTTKGGSNDDSESDYWMTWPGTYQMIVESGNKYTSGDSTSNLNNDSNGYMIRVNSENSILAQVQGTIQGSNSSNARSLYFYLPPNTSSINLKNFNFAKTGTVKYIKPNGTVINGSVSDIAKWNNGDSNNGGDVVSGLNTAINGSDVGLWEIKLENYDGDRTEIVEVDDQSGSILPIYETKYQNFSNFSIDQNDVLSLNGNQGVDHPFTVKNLFLTKDIINLATSGTNSNFSSIILNANGTPVSDTDGDGNPDTGFIDPNQGKDFILRVTPKNSIATFDKTTITATSYTDKKVDPSVSMAYSITKTTQIQSIGLAEKVTVNNVVNKIITIEYSYKNYGGSQITNLSIENNLDQVIGPGMYQILSSSKDLSNLGSLNPGETGKAQVQLKLSQYGVYVNQSKISGTSSGQVFEDVSTDGTNPDPDGNNFPAEDELTYFSIDPVKLMTVTEWIDSVVPQSNGDYVVTYGINISNNGNTNLSDVTAQDNIAATYAKYGFSLLSFSGNTQYANTGSYNGSSNIQLLKAGTSIAPGELMSFTIKIKFNPGGDKGPFYNSVAASGKTADGHVINTSSGTGSGGNVFPDPDPIPDPDNFDGTGSGGGSNGGGNNNAGNSAGVSFILPGSGIKPISYPVSYPTSYPESYVMPGNSGGTGGSSGVLGLGTELPNTGLNLRDTVFIGSIVILLVILVDGLRTEERWLRKAIKKVRNAKLLEE